MRLSPLVLTVLLVLVAGSARGAVATGEAPPRGEPPADLLVLLLGPPPAEPGARPAAGPDGLQEAREASKRGSPLPVLAFLVLEQDGRGELAWIPERRVAGSAVSGAFPTGADPPPSRTPSDASAHGYGERHQAASSQGLWREGLGTDVELLGAQFRHARPGLGRWAKRDPGGFIDGPNRYGWLLNQPFMNRDLSGLEVDTNLPWGDPGRRRGISRGFERTQQAVRGLLTGYLNSIGVVGLVVAGPVVILQAAGGAVILGTLDHAVLDGGIGKALEKLDPVEGAALFALSGLAVGASGSRAARYNEIPEIVVTAVNGAKVRAGSLIQAVQRVLRRCPRGEAVTEAAVRRALEGAPLDPTQRAVSLPVIQRFVERLRAGEGPPSIKVDGRAIVDGHHRFIAGRVAGNPPPVRPGTLPRSQQPRGWNDVLIDLVDWGNQ